MIRCYTDLEQITTFEERFEYLSLHGAVGEATFGFDRHLNQAFYHSVEWRRARNYVIARDRGCDLGIEGYEIHSEVLVHHVNPIGISEIRTGDESLFDPEFLVTTTKLTHNAIHYGDARLLRKPLVERRAGDTSLWNSRRM